MIELNIRDDKIVCLVDTGSSTSLLNENVLPHYKRIPLKTPLKFKSLNSKTEINYEVITDLPEEFKRNATMSWKLTSFEGKNFDAILGQNILKPLNAIIDMEKENITINNCTIEFLKEFPYSLDEINQLEIINLDKITTDHLYNNLNLEEKSALNIILNEGQQLTNTNIIQHEIKTITDKAIYTKIYRYPQIHEN